jgi:hypothetical protein
MALSRLAVSGGANGGRLILLFCLVPLFFLDVLLFHSVIGLSPHFFEVIGFRATPIVTTLVFSRSFPLAHRDKLGPRRKFLHSMRPADKIASAALPAASFGLSHAGATATPRQAALYLTSLC